MKRLFFLSIVLAVALLTNAQHKSAINTYLHGQAGFVPYGLFSSFTGGSFGGALQATYQLKSKLKPQLDISANLFSINKILFVFENGETTGPKQSIITVFGGFNYEPLKHFELAFSAGPAFDDDGTDFGIKPYVAYYLGRKKIVKIHTSLTHLFSPSQYSKKNSGVFNAGFAIKLF
jgi:hypothetical protein